MKKDLLIQYINNYCLTKGKEFTLSSGAKSNVYIDIKQLSQKGIYQKDLAGCLSDLIALHFRNINSVAGVVLGGCHLASLVAMDQDLDVIFVRASHKDHGTKCLIERPYKFLHECVIIEDVVTTGTSAIKTANVLTDAGFIIHGIISVVDRRCDNSSYLGDEFRKWKYVSLVSFDELDVNDTAKA